MGLVAYGGILTESQGKVAVAPKDAVRQRVYLGPLRLMIEIDMGQITALHFTSESVTMFVKKPHEAPPLSAVIVWLDSRSETQWRVTNADAEETRGGWKVKPNGSEITIKPM
jgi:glycerol kinase